MYTHYTGCVSANTRALSVALCTQLYTNKTIKTNKQNKTNKKQTNKTRLPLNKVHCLILERGGELGEWLQQPSLSKDDQQDTTVSLLQKVQNL